MNASKVGPVVTALIVAGVGLVFFLNRETAPTEPGKPVPSSGSQAVQGASSKPVGKIREYPIGDPVIKNHIEVGAVWLPSVGMAGMPEPSNDIIHVEADIRSTADNPNGFAKDEFVPYLKIQYKVFEEKGDKVLQSGELLPMVAGDGLHYGANIAKPGPGTYRLEYAIEPPSAGGLGRHSDPITGVAPWWEPFTARFEWTIDPVSTKP
jgi:hypothetical protein